MRSRWSRLSLRRRLVLLLLLLTGVVLVVSSFATIVGLRTFLDNQTDRQLEQLVTQTAGALARGDVDAGSVGVPPPGTIRLLISPDGKRALALPDVDSDQHPATQVSAQAATVLAAIPSGQDPVTVSLPQLDDSYRVQATTFPDGSKLILGLSMSSLRETVQRLIIVDIGVGILGLAIVASVGSMLISVALRSLTDVTATTRRIAETDLSKGGAAVELRAKELPITTEVGELGQGLNHMLDVIDEAFAQRNASDQRLRQFIADASHELRTPLTTIRGYAELFERTARHESEVSTGVSVGATEGSEQGAVTDTATAMRRIDQESRRMAALVDDLLLLARLDQGRPLVQQPVDLSRLVVDAASDFLVTDATRPLSLEMPAHPVMALGDEQRLRQVLANLLGNVKAHTPAGTRASISLSDEADSTVSLTVRDNGPGIAAADAPHAFDRFYRADASRTRASGGTGLGLAIVRAIVSAHGGSVTLDSAPGATSVRIELPRG